MIIIIIIIIIIIRIRIIIIITIISIIILLLYHGSILFELKNNKLGRVHSSICFSVSLHDLVTN
jgi:hypothetical protein